MLKQFSIFLLIAIIFYSCSGYNRVLKSNDLEYKYGKAVEYYKEGDCLKAIPIFEELIALYRGTAKSERIFYYFAKSHYCIKDYILAGYYFQQFSKTFPNSVYAEECSYLSAYCSYLESPNYSLDQGETKKALNDLQLFLDLYPATNKIDTINDIIDELNFKLEKKAYENSKLYLHTEKYKAATISLRNTLKEFPATQFREEIMFMIIEANYLLAINSIRSKKRERLEETIESYHKFVDNFENSSWIRQAEQYYDSAIKELEGFK